MSVLPIPVPIPLMINRFLGTDLQDLFSKPKPVREFHPHRYINADKCGYAPDLVAPSDLKCVSRQTPQHDRPELTHEPNHHLERTALGGDSHVPKQKNTTP